MRYYDLDTNGKWKGDYATPQPGMTLVLLDDMPNKESMWNGSAWVPDTDKVNARLAKEEEAEIEKLVQAELREQAVASLKAKGKLDSNGKVKK